MAGAILRWLQDARIDTALLDPGKPWQNATDESFNGKLRDESLSLQWVRNRIEARVSIEQWRRHYNEVRPHSSLAYSTPAAFKAKHLADHVHGGRRFKSCRARQSFQKFTKMREHTLQLNEDTRSNETRQITLPQVTSQTPVSLNSNRRYIMRHDPEEATALFSGAPRWGQLYLRIGESSALERS